MFDFIIEKVNDPKVKHFIIHCHAGVSRSGGVGEFIQELIGMDYSAFRQRNSNIFPNRLVKQLLRNELEKYENANS